MLKKTCIILTISINFITVTSSSPTELHEAQWVLSNNGTRENHRLMGHTLTTIASSIVTHCAKRCMEDSRCHSINFNKKLKSCQLNAHEADLLESNDTDLIEAEGYVYHTKGDFTVKNAKTIFGLCSSAPCKNGGKCVQNPNDKTKYQCICQTGWTGERCETEVGLALWAAWSVFSACSASCGHGWKMRSRDCIDKKTKSKLDSDACPGKDREIHACDPLPCPRFGPWGSWSACSSQRHCGVGRSQRMRVCMHGGRAGVDRLCLGTTTETKTCQVTSCQAPLRLRGGREYGEGRVEVLHDPRAGLWGSVCSDGWDEQDAKVACLQMGFAGISQVANTFDVDAAPYVLSAEQCSGSERTLASCRHDGWSTERKCEGGGPAGVKCIVNGGWSTWSDWGSCSVTCADGIRVRTRSCDSPLPTNGGASCPNEKSQSKPCTEKPCPVDGVWDEWGKWSTCSRSCGKGIRSRGRTCIGPFHDGHPCSGEATQEEACSTNNCPIDGEWLEWSKWDTCSLTCGGGTQSRKRSCDGPFYGGKQCSGDKSESRTCNAQPCPVDGFWKNWSEWSSCNVSCGGGIRHRSRACNLPLHGGDRCKGDSDERETCNTHNCPIDGFWEEWMAWGACSLTCGRGSQSRQRECNMPKFSGKNCTGHSIERRTCKNRECPVDGVWKNWSSWSKCSITCGGGSKTRSRTCEGPFHDGLNCSGNFTDVSECNTFPCPVDGVWLEWTAWDTCSVTCGGGEHSRTRTCKGPFHDGKECEGENSETEACNRQPCPVDGFWKDWSSWGSCTVSCGGGMQNRTRECNEPQHGGKGCSDDSWETQACNEQPCPVDGVWTSWSSWSECSRSCGGGIHNRKRACVAPRYGGKACTGRERETTPCDITYCPDGTWSDWSNWTSCDVTCGQGHRVRKRNCTGTMFGGEDCKGSAHEQDTCRERPCPVDGSWGVWSGWSDCSVTCGEGKSSRQRVCSAHAHGGKPCTGPNEEKVGCSSLPCLIPGIWQPWGSWSACTQTCGGGIKSRRRTCDMASFGDLTAPCFGVDEEILTCHDFKCYPLGHDLETSVHVDGYEGAGEFSRRLTYSDKDNQVIPLDSLISLVNASSHCEQYARWACKKSLIHNVNDSFVTFFGNRNFEMMNYFPGADPGSNMCACGKKGLCATSRVMCNCDANDDVWREDSGVFQSLDDLPIASVNAGDTGGENEEGYFTIGKLKCTGKRSHSSHE